MIPPTARRNFALALLAAVGAHVAIFFLFVVFLVIDVFAIEIEDEPEEEKQKITMQVVYAESDEAPSTEEPVLVIPPDQVPAPEPMPEPEPEPEPMPEAPKPAREAFVQTSEEQESEKAPEETPLIGERDTTATSDAGAVAGKEKMAALAGEEERKSDPKTFDSDFSEGETSGPQEGLQDSAEVGKGEEQMNKEAIAAVEPKAEVVPEMKEEAPKPNEDELAAIDNALAALDEAIGEVGEGIKETPQEEVKPVEETMPEKPAEKKEEAANRDGGFAPRARKTRIAGVLSTSGKGSLNVANTAAGRYRAAILKKLETAWQMGNIRNRSLLAPGNVTLYFVVDEKGKVSGQRQVAMIGASDTQWGMILGAVQAIDIPVMPKEVIEDLAGDGLELIVTFNY